MNLDIIKNRRNKEIQNKLDIFKLLEDSFVGGEHYIQQEYLNRYYREAYEQYQGRLERSVYINHLKSILSVFTGLIFNKEPTRNIPKYLNYLLEETDRANDINSFSKKLALSSMLATTGVLVDSPNFENINTVADRKINNLNPYCIIYKLNDIRDFYFNLDGSLDWVLLDNSYIDNSNPLEKEKIVVKYTLWTKTYCIKFLIEEKGVIVESEFFHNLGEVPFIFVNTGEDTTINTTIFEDIVLLSKKTYNTLSFLDESLASGSFKSLFFPIENITDMEHIMTMSSSNLSELSIIPFLSTGNVPFFAGASLEDTAYYLQAIQYYNKQILTLVGLDKDEEKGGAQSGEAKKLEYKRAEAFLTNTVLNLEKAEKSIFHFASLWEGKPIKVEIIYNKNFIERSIDESLAQLYELYNFIDSSEEQEEIKNNIKNLVIKN